jgi:hypothetical protein
MWCGDWLRDCGRGTADLSVSRAEQVWSVCLVVDEGEINHLANSEVVMEAMYPDGVESLTFGSTETDDGETASITFELGSPSSVAAEDRAQNLLLQGLKAIGARPRRVPVAWVLPVAETDSGAARSLAEARELLDEERYELAVISAHIYLETQVLTLLDRAINAEDRPEWVEVLTAAHNATNLNSPLCQKLVAVLLDLKVVDLDVWAAFKGHVKRRNATVHEGRAVAEEGARESLEVVEELALELAAAGRESEP